MPVANGQQKIRIDTLIYTDTNRKIISSYRIGNLYIVSAELPCINMVFFDELIGESRKRNTTAVS